MHCECNLFPPDSHDRKTAGRDQILPKASFVFKAVRLPAKKSGGGERDESPGGLLLEG